ncbi:MAG: hypothetical protein JWP89_3474 [Schlesneria sp.]|nr:hypothetical protein [Schlesneria sp.]
MSLTATCWWTLVRTVVLCLLAWPVCRWIERSFHEVSLGSRWWFLIALLIPFCFPELLVGYAFRDLALAHPKWAEALCSGLLFIRIVPVGAIALLAAPPSAVDSFAIHCRRLVVRHRGSRRGWIELAKCYWHGPIMRVLPALALMSVVAFQEFELAALLQTLSWTDWFVTAQRLGLEQGEMLRQSLWPLAWQLPVLVGVFCWLIAQRAQASDDASRLEFVNERADRRVYWLGMSCVVTFLIAGCLVPMGFIGWRTVEGFAMLVKQRSQLAGLVKEIAIAGAIAASAGLTVWAISSRLRTMAALGLPGLFGSLLLSLGCVAAFQSSALHSLYDTPVPWVLALVLWLLPRAVILRLWLTALSNNSAIHAAMLIKQANGRPSRQASSLIWQLRDQPQFLAASLVCYWAYCDLPTAYLLAPTGMASGLVRLYNFMHFGRSAALSAEALLFFGTPLVCVFLLLLVNRTAIGLLSCRREMTDKVG